MHGAFEYSLQYIIVTGCNSYVKRPGTSIVPRNTVVTITCTTTGEIWRAECVDSKWIEEEHFCSK